MTEQETAPSPSVQPNNSSATSERLLVLGAGRADRNYRSDLWSYRELYAILAWRDLVVRYKQNWRSVRGCMPAADNCHIYVHLQQGRQDAERERRALPDCPSPLKLSHTVRSELGVQDGSKAVFG
jgi:hypothetical protein